MAPFDRSYTVRIELPVLLVAIFSLSHVHSKPPLGVGRRRNIAITFGVEKLEWRGYPVVNKNLAIAIANRSRVSCAHNTLRASIGLNITP